MGQLLSTSGRKSTSQKSESSTEPHRHTSQHSELESSQQSQSMSQITANQSSQQAQSGISTGEPLVPTHQLQLMSQTTANQPENQSPGTVLQEMSKIYCSIFGLKYRSESCRRVVSTKSDPQASDNQGIWKYLSLRLCAAIVVLLLGIIVYLLYYIYQEVLQSQEQEFGKLARLGPVSYTHLRAHETLRYLVCRLLLE